MSNKIPPAKSPSEKAALKRVQFRLAVIFWLVAQAAFASGILVNMVAHQGHFFQNGGITAALLFVVLSAGFSSLISVYVADPISKRLEMVRRVTQDAGHELLTPVSIIRSRLQLFERELQESGESSEHLPVILRAMDRMDNLIQDLRVLNRAESPNRHLSLSIVNLNKTIQNSVDELQIEFEAKSITTQLSLIPLSIVGDEQALQRLFINLLTNAIRYGRTGGQVSISMKKERGNVTLVIGDDGPGIPEESLPNIFDRFYRVDESRSRLTGGSGLGLAIVKAIVDSHAGKISVRSSSAGTSFVVILPQLPHHPALPLLKGWQE